MSYRWYYPILVLGLILAWPRPSAGAEDYWAFRPITRPSVPAVNPAVDSLPQTPIDAFIAARLAEHGLVMNHPADPRERVRRAYFDLTGLPPTPQEVEAFVADPSPQAWARLVDDLLARPQYGERWGRHWLDVVRFAETSGYERDGEKPYAWRYRDYVIEAFNQDKPYNRFVLEQLAGDQLPNYSADAIVATGFYRLHVWDDEPDNTVESEFDDLDDIMVATSGAFMGLTIGCARCHDHKFDPISQKEYYQLLAFFRSVNPHGVHHTGGGGRGLGRITRPLASPQELDAWDALKKERVREAETRLAAASGEESKKALEEELKKARAAAPPFPTALAVTEDELKSTHLLVRGRYNAPGEEVEPAMPKVLGGWRYDSAKHSNAAETDPRRLALAQWLVGPANPLTARVMANRVWQYHFGRGLVASPNDFGKTGELPTHPELLDYLASELISGGWSVKRLHKLIMTSQAYSMSSKASIPEALKQDEGNQWFWRQNPRRLEGEAIRDSVLAFSGALNLTMGGPGIFPELPLEVHQTQDSARKGWGKSQPADQARRSIYVFVKRALPLPFLDVFDYSTTASPLPRRPVTTVAPQALMMLNDPFMQKQGEVMARRLAREVGEDPGARIERAFQLVLQRAPTADDKTRALQMLQTQQNLLPREEGPGALGITAWARFCVAMLNLNEAIYVD